jgi:hypothetical protein
VNDINGQFHGKKMPAKNVIRSLLRYLVFLSVFYLSSAWSGLLVKEDVDKLFADQYLVGDIQPNMPLWPLFTKNPAEPDAKPELKAYVFETIDFEPVRGYGGKPIDVMVVMDVNGNFLQSKLLDHKEPLFRSEAGIAKLTKFAAQFSGLTTITPKEKLRFVSCSICCWPGSCWVNHEGLSLITLCEPIVCSTWTI